MNNVRYCALSNAEAPSKMVLAVSTSLINMANLLHLNIFQSTSAVGQHMVAPAKEGQVFRVVVECIPVLVVNLGPVLSAFLTLFDSVYSPGASSANIWIGCAWFVVVMVWAAAHIPGLASGFQFYPMPLVRLCGVAGFAFLGANPDRLPTFAPDESARPHLASLAHLSINSIGWNFGTTWTTVFLPRSVAFES